MSTQAHREEHLVESEEIIVILYRRVRLSARPSISVMLLIPPVIEGDDDVLIKDIFVPPELHLFTGIVNHLIDYLISLTPANLIIYYLKSINILRATYHGGKLEGNQCSRIVNNLDQIELLI